MLTLKDPILTVSPPPDGIDLPPLREPESLDMSTWYVSSAGATVMGRPKSLLRRDLQRSRRLPASNRFGERVSDITGRFVLSGSSDAYRTRRFQSAEPPIGFPVSEEGWAFAGTTFHRMESQTA